MSSHDSELDGASFKIMHGLYHRINSNPFPGWNSSIENEGSAGDMSVYGSRRPKHSGEGRRMASVSTHNPAPYDRQVAGGGMSSLLHNSYYASSEDTHKEHRESKYPNLTLNPSISYPVEDRLLSGKMAKEYKYYGERRAFNEHCISSSAMIRPTNEMRATNRSEFPQQLCSRKASMSEAPVKKSTVELPSSFSEDETSSSED